MDAVAAGGRIRSGRSAPATPARWLGFWSAILVAVSCVAFMVAAVHGLLGGLAPPWDVVAPLVPSLLLAPAFLVMVASIHHCVPDEKKVWSHLALTFAGLYAPLVSVAYVVELSVVEPLALGGQADRVALLTLTRPGTVLNAVDGLGYGFMSLATLFAAPIFTEGRLGRWIGRLFVANGILAIPILLTYFVDPAFIYAAAPWGVTIAGSAILLALSFRRQESRAPSAQPRRASMTDGRVRPLHSAREVIP